MKKYPAHVLTEAELDALPRYSVLSVILKTDYTKNVKKRLLALAYGATREQVDALDEVILVKEKYAYVPTGIETFDFGTARDLLERAQSIEVLR